MRRRPLLVLTAVPLSAAALVAGLLGAVPASAAVNTQGTGNSGVPTTPAPDATVTAGVAAVRPSAHAAVRDGLETVSLQLTPRDRSLLAATAAASSTLSRTTRLARLDAAVAGTGRANQVAAISRRLGLTVVGGTEFSVTLTGSPARVLALFGSARASDPQSPTAQPLPVLPVAYAGLVTVAEGGDETRPAVLSHLQTAASLTPRATGNGLTVAQARSLYGVTATTALPTTSSPIVATLQFSSWTTQTADLKSFASDNKLYSGTFNPAATVSSVTVSDSCGTIGSDGDDEVALDQETLLAEAPQLQQRIYFAPNCGDSQDEAINQVTSDVKAGKAIVALSTSWGECEDSAYAADKEQATADQDAIQAVEAAGVTVFAASGDDGSSDCVDVDGHQIAGDAVDSPAVVPGVIGVGGTSLTAGGGSTVWDDAPDSAGGGGFSCGIFARPSYQNGVAATPTYPHNTSKCPASRSARQVPDIAADAGDGLSIVDTQSGSGVAYGTSFAAPLAAGGFAQTLVDEHHTTGLGDITAKYLYPNYTCGGFQDVTTGRNGDYAAGPGYDEATGLGTPMWPALLDPVQTNLPNPVNACIERVVLTKILTTHHGF